MRDNWEWVCANIYLENGEQIIVTQRLIKPDLDEIAEVIASRFLSNESKMVSIFSVILKKNEISKVIFTKKDGEVVEIK